MSLRIKLVLLIVLVAITPLLITAATTLGLHRRAFEEKVAEMYRMSARFGAAMVQQELSDIEQRFATAVKSIRWAELSDEGRREALQLLYRQFEELAVVSLTDDGRRQIASVAAPEGSVANGRPRLTEQGTRAFAASIPFVPAALNGFAVGDAFADEKIPAPLLPLAVGIPGPDPGRRWVVAAGFSLASICREVIKMGADGARVYLSDPKKRIACRSRGGAPLSSPPVGLKPQLSVHAPVDITYTSVGGEEVLANIAPTPDGWVIAVVQPLEAAFSTSRAILVETIVAVVLSILVAALIGHVLGRKILTPVGELIKGATELAQGNVGYRMRFTGRDELGTLSAAFNRMGEQLQKRDAEIRKWNRDLQERVDEQTRVLESIQDQLLHSHKIAAVTSLGAGVAHEINNPLTAVIGLTQVLLASADKDPVLEKQRPVLENIEREALRIKRIVGALQSFSGSYAGEGYSTFDVADLIREIARSEEEMLGQARIELITRFAPDLARIHGNQAQLRQVFLELVKNARTAMPAGGRITISASMIGNRVVEIIVADTGKGIAKEHIGRVFEPFFTTKEDWRSQGLGLTMVFHTVEDHHGTIRIESEPGKGTAIALTFPADQGGAHIV